MSIHRMLTAFALAVSCLGSAGVAQAGTVKGSATLPSAVLPSGVVRVVVHLDVNTSTGGTLGMVATAGGGQLSAAVVDLFGFENEVFVLAVVTSSAITGVFPGDYVGYYVQDNGAKADRFGGVFYSATLGEFLFYDGAIGGGNLKVEGTFPSGCFAAGTRITMADGSEKPIEQIEVGEQVLGPNGELNRVMAVQRPLLGARKLYGLNDSTPFFTDGHPFMTKEGWKSINPAATAAENPTLTVTALKTGDVLTRMQAFPAPGAQKSGAPKLTPAVRLETLALERVEARAAHPTTQLYNLQLDGTHVYFANGYLVHNK